ncbi:hypothetical protein [Paenibacillus oleatilyticus]|uniref:DUF4163 domain-containing protein n=1 Tax=Paenibacillus oleatilyticus TaxID=2594886 RepID=A0ABV4UW86_9BACL
MGKMAYISIMASLLAFVLASCNNISPIEKTNVMVTREAEKNNLHINNNKSGAPEVTSYTVDNSIYREDEIIVEYPHISNLSDHEKQNTINEILKTEAFSVLGDYKNTKDLALKIEFKITREDRNLISVKYYGVGYEKGAAYPSNLFYTVNIDMNTGRKIQLKDYMNINKKFIEQLRQCKVKESEINQASSSGLDYINEAYSDEELIKYLNGADSSYKNSAFAFSYFTKDALGISIEVPHSVGDHLEMELNYRDILSNINNESEIRNYLK